ncbi:MAG: TetR/AcrR family transcriptional regulator [Desulfosudaceae bacterium]
MPKAARSPEEVQEVRSRILEEAVDLITEKGFDQLSMRSIAGRAGMTAANIYNYYQNKDELYLDIQTHGFARLYERLDQAVRSAADPREQVRSVIRAYLSFGLDCASLYEIMFSLNTPKFADYQHTPLEPVAFIEKETALQSARLVIETFAAVPPEAAPVSPEEAYFRTIQVWTALHGLVSLRNSRVLQEVEEDTAAFIERCVEEYSRLFFRDNVPL